MNRKIIDRVASYIEANNMVANGDGIVVGVSGGADSVCLLFLLCGLREKYNLQLHAVHINHGIRAEAGEDAAFVERLCDAWQVPCDIVHFDIPALAAEWKMSEEEAGRKARYEAFSEAASKYDCGKIAVAHNVNDKAETILFHMFRGSGLHGLTGIPAVRKHKDALIIRPILCLGRDEIEEVLRGNGIDWVTDKTNLEDKYARNRIRHNILPEAESVAPGAVKHICEVADKLAETEEFLEKLEAECLADCSISEKDNEIVLDAKKLSAFHSVIKKRAVLTCLKNVCGGGKDIGSLQVEQVMDLFDREGNREINLARGISARRSYDNVVIFTERDAFAPESTIDISFISADEIDTDIEQLMESVAADNELNRYTKWLDYDRIDGQLEVRTRKTGDFFMLQNADGEYHRKSLKDYMIDMKIPAAERDNIPVVACGSHCVWLVGYRISDYCKLTLNTKRIVKLERK